MTVEAMPEDLQPLTPGLAEAVANQCRGKTVMVVLESNNGTRKTREVAGTSEGTYYWSVFVTIAQHVGDTVTRRFLDADHIKHIYEIPEDAVQEHLNAYRQPPSG